MEEKLIPKVDLTALTAEIVGAYVKNNTLPSSDLPNLILNVHTALADLAVDGVGPKGDADAQKPAVPIKKSVNDEYLICLEDGKQFKSLKRHLRTHYNLSPEEYREKWKLPPTYPMVAPAYAKRRSELAKKMGLGNGRRK